MPTVPLVFFLLKQPPPSHEWRCLFFAPGYEECFVVRRVFLKRGGFFGVSAATGDLADNHDIVSLKVGEARGDKGRSRAR